MKKINLRDIKEESWSSPKGKFQGSSKEISVALGREPASADLGKRHPFDVELLRLAPGQTPIRITPTAPSGNSTMSCPAAAPCATRMARQRSKPATPLFSRPVSRMDCSTMARKIFSSAWSPTTRSASPATTPTARSGWYVRPSGGWSAWRRATISMARNSRNPAHKIGNRPEPSQFSRDREASRNRDGRISLSGQSS